MTELAAPQISSLMEARPGIAHVLRSPVANAIIALSRAGAGLEEYAVAHAEELMRYGVRRNLLTQDEVDRVLGEIMETPAGKASKPLVIEKPKRPTPPPPRGVPVAAVTPPAAPPKPAPAVKAPSSSATITRQPACDRKISALRRIVLLSSMTRTLVPLPPVSVLPSSTSCPPQHRGCG